ncbi:MAG: CoA transferase [Alphaproteobacteria bacterium]|nr:CoA transferase [Alphaproteobacteria bacterium]
MAGVLEGVRILDFGRYIAGPWCAGLLADLGAEVIRIDKVGGGEDRFVVPLTDEGDGAMYQQMNRNKRGMTLNNRAPEGQEILRRMVKDADVVVANLPEKALVALGLDYDSLTAIKPDIILTTTTAFGTKGPYAAKVGFDPVAQGMSGLMHLTGYEEPMRSAASWVDFNTATLSALGTLAAIMSHRATGKGQRVQTSLLSTALTTASPALIEQAMHNVNRVGTGNRGQVSAPADVFKTKDGWIYVIVLGDSMYRKWVGLMGEDSWLTDPRFKTDEMRADHAELFSERTQKWAETLTNEEALAALEEARVPGAPIYTPQQALECEHIEASGYLTSVEFPGTDRPVPLADTPIQLSGTPGGVKKRAPQLGEHTDEILSELGYSADEINAIRDAKAV